MAVKLLVGSWLVEKGYSRDWDWGKPKGCQEAKSGRLSSMLFNVPVPEVVAFTKKDFFDSGGMTWPWGN